MGIKEILHIGLYIEFLNFDYVGMIATSNTRNTNVTNQ